jgi:hypothetical protein
MTTGLTDAYAVLVGIERYGFDGNDLRGPASDVDAMADLLIRAGLPSGQIKVHKVTSGTRLEEATQDIVRCFDRTMREVSAQHLVVYWSGHGLEYEQDQWLCYPEASLTDWRAVNFNKTLFDSLGRTAYRFPTQYFFVDACREIYDRADLPRGPQGHPFAPAGDRAGHQQYAILASPSGVTTANFPDQQSGAFSQALRKVLADEPFPWSMNRVWERLANSGLQPVTISANFPDGTFRRFDLGRREPDQPDIGDVQARDWLRRLADDCRPPAFIIKQARNTTLQVFANFVSGSTSVLPPPDDLWPTATFLLERTTDGLSAVLDFVERVADLSELAGGSDADIAGVIGERCEELVRDSPFYRSALAEIRGRIAGRRARLRSRPHVLVRIRPSQDNDPGEKSDDEFFGLQMWQYRDEWDDAGATTEPADPVDVLFMADVPGAELAQHIRESLVAFPDPQTVVELMLDDLTLADRTLHALVDDLARDRVVVLRPDQQAERRNWFANWRKVVRGVRLTRLGRGSAPPPGCAAAVLLPPVTDAVFERLLSAGIPVALWDGTAQGAGPGFTRSNTLLATLMAASAKAASAATTAAPTLMWHNPHWFPDDVDGLSWRGEVTA